MRRFLKWLPLVLLGAALVRVVGITEFPPGLWFDEGLNGVDAWWSLHDGMRFDAQSAQFVPNAPRLRMTYPDVFPREPMLVWLLAPVLALTGPETIAMRLTVAAIGAAACGAWFLAAGAAERRRGLGFALAAAFVLATMHWHAHFSRLVFRTNLVPLFAAAFVGAAATAAHRGRLAWFAAAGAVLGGGFYTYLSWYFFLPAAAVWIWALARDDDGNRRFGARETATLCAAAALVAAPLAVHYALHPERLLGRPGALSPFHAGLAEGLVRIAANARDVALMFWIRGDHVMLHNVAAPAAPDSPLFGKTGTPVLDPAWAGLFVVGLLGACARLAQAGGARRRAAAWLAWLVCMSLPSVFSRTDSANMLRNLGAAPAVAFFIANGWWELDRRWAARLQRRAARRGLRVLAALLLIAGAGTQVWKLQATHPRVEDVAEKFSGMHVRLAAFAEAHADADAPLFVPTDFLAHKTFEFLTLDAEELRPFNARTLLTRSNGEDHRVLCTAFSRGNLETLRALFPRGRIEGAPLADAAGNPLAAVFRIPAASLLAPEAAQAAARESNLIEEH